MYNFSSMRRKMVFGQVLPNKIVEARLIDTLEKLPREKFVPDDQKPFAYGDEAVFLNRSHTRFLLPPAVFASLVQSARIKETDHVLDIGCGSGYSAILLSFLARIVVALESDQDLFLEMKKNIRHFECYGIHPVTGPLKEGWSHEGPYDVILIEGCVEHIPSSLLSQLKEGGRLLTLQRVNDTFSRGILMTRSGKNVSTRTLFEASCPLLPDFKEETVFCF